MSLNQKLIDEIIRRILSVIHPERVILFGSAAVGEMTSDSDIDILVLKGPIDNVMEDRVRIDDALRGLGYPFDVLLMTPERFEETKDVIGGIAYPANKYGMVIYETA